jgi:hypothetical protein
MKILNQWMSFYRLSNLGQSILVIVHELAITLERYVETFAPWLHLAGTGVDR